MSVFTGDNDDDVDDDDWDGGGGSIVSRELQLWSTAPSPFLVSMSVFTGYDEGDGDDTGGGDDHDDHDDHDDTDAASPIHTEAS